MDLKNQSKLIIACLLLSACGSATFHLFHTISFMETPSAAMSEIVITSDNIADGFTPAKITLSIRTPSGQPVQGMAMALWVSGTQNVIIPCGQTDHHGLSHCRIFSTKAELKTVIAKGQISLTAQTRFLPARSAKNETY